MSVQVSYKKQVTFFIILILIFAVIAESILQVIELMEPTCMFTKSEIFSDYSISEKNQMCDEYSSLELDYLQPFAITKPNQVGKFVNINSDGFRGNEIRDDDKYMVIFLGGSTAFGTVTSSDETTIPALIEKKLNEENLNIQIINAGIPSATSIDELYLLENYLLKYNPDLVIMYDGWNDIVERKKVKFNIQYEEYKKNTYIENYADFLNSDIENTSQNNSGTGILKFFIHIDYKTGIGLASFIRDNLISNSDNLKNEIKSSQNILDLTLIENRLKNNWQKVCNLGEQNLFKTVNIIQPGLGTSSRDISNEEKIWMSETTQIDELNYLKKIDVRKLENNNCKNIIDLRNTFDNVDNKTIFFDSIHTSDYGNGIVSEKIINIIIPIIQNNT